MTHIPLTPPKTKGETYEGIAFQFCKVATVALLAGRFTLPVASGLCAIFYIFTLANGKHDTRCFLRNPWILVAFWGAISVASTYFILDPTYFTALWRHYSHVQP